MQRKSLLISVLLVACGMAYATTAAKGFFTVNGSGKMIQFADANELNGPTHDLFQWSYANEWREEQKNAEGHNGWYVLSAAEWTYLMVTRDGSKNALGSVNGQNGLVILPDGWVQPAGVPVFKPVTSGTDYANNPYTTAEWAIMEAAGAVFLPCGGYSTSGGDPTDATDHGVYWSATADEDNSSNAWVIEMDDGGITSVIHDHQSRAKTNYYSVRLVRTVPTLTVLDEDDESEAFATKLAAADDYSYAVMQRTLLRNGYLNTLCLPFDVPNIDASPLAGAEVYTFDGGTVSGTTGQEILHLNLTRLSGQRLSQGVPYLIRWMNTTGTLDTLYFYNVENWDDNTSAGDDVGNANIKMHGFYYKTHITGSASPSEAHYNFFLGNNNAITWPTDGGDATKKMKGFRTHFYTLPGGTPSAAPIRRNMQTVWDIDGEREGATGIQNTPLNVQAEKLFRDGRVILHINGHLYDMSGKRLNDQ